MNEPIGKIWGGVGRYLKSARAMGDRILSSKIPATFANGPISSMIGGSLGMGLVGAMDHDKYGMSRRNAIMAGAIAGAGVGYGAHWAVTSGFANRMYKSGISGLSSMSRRLSGGLGRAANRIDPHQSLAYSILNDFRSSIKSTPTIGPKIYRRY